MRKVIDGKVYDTETAEVVCDVSGSTRDVRDFNYDDTDLYRSPKGAFFVAGKGNASSRWRQSAGQNAWSSGSGLELVDAAEARRLVEQHGDEETFRRLFGEPEEG